jgi:uncharacterized protein YqeY
MKERITRDIQAAMKSRESERLSTLRMILAELQRKEKEKGLPVDEPAAIQLLQSMIRRRKEAIEQFRRGGRDDLADREQREIPVIEAYLPEQLDDAAVRAEACAVIAALGARSPRDMGRVMGALTKKLSGRTDGATISRIVRDELNKGVA